MLTIEKIGGVIRNSESFLLDLWRMMPVSRAKVPRVGKHKIQKKVRWE